MISCPAAVRLVEWVAAALLAAAMFAVWAMWQTTAAIPGTVAHGYHASTFVVSGVDAVILALVVAAGLLLAVIAVTLGLADEEDGLASDPWRATQWEVAVLCVLTAATATLCVIIAAAAAVEGSPLLPADELRAHCAMIAAEGIAGAGLACMGVAGACQAERARRRAVVAAG